MLIDIKSHEIAVYALSKYREDIACPSKVHIPNSGSRATTIICGSNTGSYIAVAINRC